MNYRNLLVALCAVTAIDLCAQQIQSDIRQNPVIDVVSIADTVAYPAYLNLGSNRIEMNGDNWTALARTIKNAGSSRVNIVHIGDSHLQADMGTAVTRNRMLNRYGNGGRGLVVPFRLAGTNQPVDYVVESDSTMKKSRLLKTPWDTAMGFTGIGVEPTTENFNLRIRTGIPFDKIVFHYSGDSLRIENGDSCSFENYKNVCEVQLPEQRKSIAFNLKAQLGTALHGIDLLSGTDGLVYNVIGNNGATYETYNGINGFANDISKYNPALIILSLGTNEAFNNESKGNMYCHIDRMVSSLRKACPEAKILLTTPSECHIKEVVKKRVRRKGRRRRYKTVTETVYRINGKVAEMREVIKDYAQRNGLPVYDFYEVAGGNGSSDKWLEDRFLNSDHIHMTLAGYKLQGSLFTDALIQALEK